MVNSFKIEYLTYLAKFALRRVKQRFRSKRCLTRRGLAHLTRLRTEAKHTLPQFSDVLTKIGFQRCIRTSESKLTKNRQISVTKTTIAVFCITTYKKKIVTLD